MNVCGMCGVHIHQVKVTTSHMAAVVFILWLLPHSPTAKNNWVSIFGKIAENKQNPVLENKPKASFPALPIFWKIWYEIIQCDLKLKKLRIIIHFQRNSEYVSQKQFVLWAQSSMYRPLSRDTLLSHPSKSLDCLALCLCIIPRRIAMSAPGFVGIVIEHKGKSLAGLRSRSIIGSRELTTSELFLFSSSAAKGVSDTVPTIFYKLHLPRSFNQLVEQ